MRVFRTDTINMPYSLRQGRRGNTSTRSSRSTNSTPDRCDDACPPKRERMNSRQLSEAERSASIRAEHILFKAHEAESTTDSVEVTRHRPIPRLSPAEVETGSILGVGGFGVVRKVSGFRVAVTKEEEDGQQHKMTSPLLLNKGSKKSFAIKTLKEEHLMDPTIFAVSAVDMAIEAHFLSKLRHPNIIVLHASSSDKMCGAHSFIVVDRLYGTLARRMYQWARQESRARKPIHQVLQRVKSKKNDPRSQLEERLLVAYCIADALRYLHGAGIVHRDLKPDNIGFDVNGIPKIFDFGLARALSPSDLDGDGLYRLSGCTGSMRYMAPEVFNCLPYNTSADMHSFGVLLYEIMALKKAFAKFSETMFEVSVFQRGFRPPVEPDFPRLIQDLIKRSWCHDFRARPSAKEASQILSAELISCGKHEAIHVGAKSA